MAEPKLEIWRRLFAELADTTDGSGNALLDVEGVTNLNVVVDLMEEPFTLDRLGEAMWHAPGYASIAAYYARLFRHRANNQKDVMDEAAASFYTAAKQPATGGKLPSDRTIDERVRTHEPYVQHRRWYQRLLHYASQLGELYSMMETRCRMLEQLSNNYRQERRIEEEK